MAKDQRNLLQRLRVPIGFLAVVFFLVLAQPTWATLVAGAPVTLAGLWFRGWASGHLMKNAELTVTGPYAHTRNPLYFGSLLMLIGAAVSGGTLWLGAFLIFLFLVVYYPVVQAEKRWMRTLFAAQYDDWSKSVPLFIPRLTSSWIQQSPPARRFAVELYTRHREYRALLGAAFIYSLLAAKILMLT